MPTNLELEQQLKELVARVEALEQRHTHELGSRGMLNYVGQPVTIKNGIFKPFSKEN